MKRLVCILLISLAINASGQVNDQSQNWEKEILSNKALSSEEYKEKALRYDYSSLWTNPDNSHVIGFIGENYQRLRIKIISAKKDRKNPDKYFIYGKSMRDNRVRQFNGTIRIAKARIYKDMHRGIDDEYKNEGIRKQGIIIAEYRFEDDRNEAEAGVFEGRVYSAWYIDRNDKLRYDDIEKDSDSYSNNQFVGTWRSNVGALKLPCNWGDHRIPLSGDLDGGAGEFSPIDKYLQNGWQRHRDAYINNSEQARREEERKWW